MKALKKTAAFLFAICLAVPCFFMVSHAANSIMFEDPSASVGQKLALKGVIAADSAIEDREIVMTYDTERLKFVSGENVTESPAGQLTYKATGAAGGQRVEFVMNFDVLKAGTAKVSVKSYTIYSTTNARLTCNEGSSTITIAEGDAPAAEDPADPSASAATVEVSGVEYTISESFPESDIPAGFSESSLEYGGTSYKVVYQEATGLYLAYLTDAQGEGAFFLYVEENATFAPFEQLTISDTTVITLLSNVEDLVFPSTYQQTTVDINGDTFPAWRNLEQEDLCILYAINNHGEKALYQYDIKEGTYQRFTMPEAEEEKDADTFAAKLSAALGDHLNTVVLAIGFGFIILLILTIVLSVKLYNRNAELDEVYDEFGIDLFDEGGSKEKRSRIINLDEEEDDDAFDDIGQETEDDIVIAELDEVEEEQRESEAAPEPEALEPEPAQPEVLEPAPAQPEVLEPAPSQPEVLEPVPAQPESPKAEPSEPELAKRETPASEEERLEDAMKEVAAEIKADEGYWDEEENNGFEMDFIDLDD